MDEHRCEQLDSIGGSKEAAAGTLASPDVGDLRGLRKSEMLYDLFRQKIGVVARTEINGEEVFGVTGDSPAHRSADKSAARKLRSALIEKYPDVMKTHDIGQVPNDALFHAETTVLLRAARKNGDTLAGQTLEVFVERSLCSSCWQILPYVGLELGNPTVTFVPANGERKTMRDGAWLKK